MNVKSFGHETVQVVLFRMAIKIKGAIGSMSVFSTCVLTMKKILPISVFKCPSL